MKYFANRHINREGLALFRLSPQLNVCEVFEHRFVFWLQVDELREAIEELYYFEFVLDDVPIWGFVGYIEESGFLPHSHKVRAGKPRLLRLLSSASSPRVSSVRWGCGLTWTSTSSTTVTP